MNLAAGTNASSLPLKDTFSAAVTRNVVTVALCITINYINGTMVHTYLRHEVFHMNPRYTLFIHLVLNDMVQLTIAVLMHVTSYIFFTINVSVCCVLLMVALFTTLNTPLNLASMAVECYVAVCYPLQHAQICTTRRTFMLIGFIWTLGAINLLSDLFVLLATEPLAFFHSSVFCLQETVFRRPFFLEKRDVYYMTSMVLVWAVLTYTYTRILFAAKAATSDARKARNTIVLHGAQLLLSMLTYLGPVLQTSLVTVLPLYTVEVRFVIYVIVYILPRFLNPIIYGLRDQKFRKYLMNYLCGYKCVVTIKPSKIDT